MYLNAHRKSLLLCVFCFGILESAIVIVIDTHISWIIPRKIEKYCVIFTKGSIVKLHTTSPLLTLSLLVWSKTRYEYNNTIQAKCCPYAYYFYPISAEESLQWHFICSLRCLLPKQQLITSYTNLPFELRMQSTWRTSLYYYIISWILSCVT